MKKWIAGLLGITMVFSLAGCSQPSTTTGGGSEKTAALTEEEGVSTEKAAASTEKSADQEGVYGKGKTVTVITDADPGSNSDILTRKWAELFTKYSGSDTMVVNEPAASGVMAMNLLLKADSDGFTLMQQSQSLPLTVAAGTAPFKADEVTPLFGLTEDSMWISVAADSKYQTIEDLIKACKDSPGTINGAGNKTKGIVHYWACLLMQDMGMDFNFIPYDSGNAQITGVIAGDADFMLLSNNRSAAEVAGGTMRCLAVTGDKKFDTCPDAPTLGEIGYEKANSVTVWRGIFCKAGTDESVIEELEKINGQITEDPEWGETITSMGMAVSNKDRGEFTQAYNDVVNQGAEAFEWYDNHK